MKKKKTVKPTRYSSRVLDTINVLPRASAEAITDLKAYADYVEGLRTIASEKTHYHDLNVWSDKAYEFIHAMLKKYGFVNGDPEANALLPDATLWWMVYGLISNVIYSPHLKTQVAYHHASAYERNEALILELKDVISNIPTK
jgi:hypothetical protein